MKVIGTQKCAVNTQITASVKLKPRLDAIAEAEMNRVLKEYCELNKLPGQSCCNLSQFQNAVVKYKVEVARDKMMNDQIFIKLFGSFVTCPTF